MVGVYWESSCDPDVTARVGYYLPNDYKVINPLIIFNNAGYIFETTS